MQKCKNANANANAKMQMQMQRRTQWTRCESAMYAMEGEGPRIWWMRGSRYDNEGLTGYLEHCELGGFEGFEPGVGGAVGVDG